MAASPPPIPIGTHLTLAFIALSILLLVGVAGAGQGTRVRRVVEPAVGYLLRMNWMLRGVRWVLKRRWHGIKVVTVVLLLAWVWFVTIVTVEIRQAFGAAFEMGVPDFSTMPVLGRIFASFVLLFIGTVWVVVSVALITGAALFPLALAMGSARRGGFDRTFAIGIAGASGMAAVTSLFAFGYEA